MNLIQQAQVQNLSTDISSLQSSVATFNNTTFDLFNSAQTFSGVKTFASDTIFNNKVQIGTEGLAYDFSLSGNAFIGNGNNFYFGGTSKYLSSLNGQDFSINSTAPGASGRLLLGANRSVNINAPVVDLTNQGTQIHLLQSAAAFSILTSGSISPALAIDSSVPAAPKIGIGVAAPTLALDVSGAARIDAAGGTLYPLTLSSTGSPELYVKFEGLTGNSLVGTYDAGTTGIFQSFNVLANNDLALTLGHTARQFMRINYNATSGSSAVLGESNSATFPTALSDALVEMQSTGSSDSPILTLLNDASNASGSKVYIRYLETGTSTAPGPQSWAMGSYHATGITGSSFRIARSAGYGADLGTQDYLIISASGETTLGGNVGISGALTTSSSITPLNTGLSLGSSAKPWKDVYVDSGSLYVGSVRISESGGLLSVSGAIDSTAGTAGAGWQNYQTRIKLLPKDFMTDQNNGGGSSHLLVYDGAPPTRGLRVYDADNDMYAFTSIPSGYKATGVMIYGAGTNGYCVQESDLQGNWGSFYLASGTVLNTGLALTPHATGSEDNFLVIKVEVTNTSDRVYGGYVSIAKLP